MDHKTDTDKGRKALEAYLKDCDDHAIVPDVGGAFHYAFMAGRASLAASAGSDGVASLSAAEPADTENLRKALQFYADRHHFLMHDETAWDTVSGEPVNFYEDDACTATVEDGSIAKLALAGHPINLEDDDETPTLTQGAAIAAGAVYAEMGYEQQRAIMGGERNASLAAFDHDARLSRAEERIYETAFNNGWDRRASHGQAPAQPLTVAQVEEAIGLRSKAWDTIGAEKIVEAVLQMVNRQAPAQPDAPLPLLVRDIAAELGITAPQACKSLFAAGCGETSVNMAVTPRMARALRAMHPTPSPQAAQQAPAGATEKYDDTLLPFLTLMRKELHANASKGDRPGWLKMSADTALLEIYWHTAKLSAAVKNNDGPAITEHSADVANMAMMLLDVCGGISAAPAAPSTPASGGATVKFTDAHVSYINRYGGNCRDCADESGVCPGRGLPCADSGKAIRFVLEALAYGLNNGYVASPTIEGESNG